ncbi:MAG: phosphotransferase family protein [Acidimicrobiales bacterium]
MVIPADEVAARLGRALGGTVSGLRRLSGGASRTTSSLELRRPDGTITPLILQQDRGSLPDQGSRANVQAALLTAARAVGVPVPEVVAAGPDGLPPGWLVAERVDGESIPRKILRDPEWAGARSALTAQCGHALAAIHGIDPAAIDGLPPRDPLDDPRSFLDALGEVRPALELGVRWLGANRPPSQSVTTVHGDFRMGNLLIGQGGLRAVLDWELAHVGEPAEDIGWLCAPAWRFGGPGRVGGFGDLGSLLEAYTAAGGEYVEESRVHWWEVYATVKWAVICALQASAHLSGRTRSIELAAIGRRVCESEWDLFTLLGVVPEGEEPPLEVPEPRPPLSPFGRPTLEELAEALGEHLERLATEPADGSSRFEARIAANVLGTIGRQLDLGPAVARAHARRLARLGFDDDATLASAVRRGTFDDDWAELGAVLATSARDQLLVANPSYLP